MLRSAFACSPGSSAVQPLAGSGLLAAFVAAAWHRHTPAPSHRHDPKLLLEIHHATKMPDVDRLFAPFLRVKQGVSIFAAKTLLPADNSETDSSGVVRTAGYGLYAPTLRADLQGGGGSLLLFQVLHALPVFGIRLNTTPGAFY